MSSIVGVHGNAGQTNDSASKAGLIGLTKSLAKEIGSRGVRVNCIAPSAVMNERMEQHMSDAQRAQLVEAFPLGRIGEPDDVALAALFLISDTSSWITGVTLDVSGGRIIV